MERLEDVEEKPIQSKPWWKRWWGITAIVLGGLIILGTLADTSGEKPEEGDVAAGTSPTTQDRTNSDLADPVPADDGNGGTQAPDDERTEAPPAATRPVGYEILEIDDISGNRYTARVVLEGQPTAEQIRVTALRIMERLRESNPYSGLTIFMYKWAELSEGPFTLGKLEDAPNGEWEAAFGAPVGDYSNHAQSISVREHDWSKAPSKEDVELYAAWEARLDELANDSTVDAADEEDVAFADVAESTGVPEEDVRAAVDRAAFWAFEGELIKYPSG